MQCSRTYNHQQQLCPFIALSAVPLFYFIVCCKHSDTLVMLL